MINKILLSKKLAEIEADQGVKVKINTHTFMVTKITRVMSPIIIAGMKASIRQTTEHRTINMIQDEDIT